jgi:putative ABC transport system substrate-binding protein
MQFGQLKRREFITLLGGAAAWPLAVAAQQAERIRRIGILMTTTETDSQGQDRFAAFRQGLAKLGWTDARNLQIETRWGAGNAARVQTLAAELAALKPDLLIATNTSSLTALQSQTHAIPIIFTQVVDPLGLGFVTSLARPGGNITGFSTYEFSVGTKWSELLKQIAPHVIRLAVIYDPSLPSWKGFFGTIDAAARSLGIQASAFGVRDSGEIEREIVSFARGSNGGLIAVPGAVTVIHRNRIIALAAEHRLPAVYAYRFFATSGGLASYGVDDLELYRQLGNYVDRVLKGEKPGDLPVQQATKYELVINLKTAKALGLDPPISLLARTDEVIE